MEKRSTKMQCERASSVHHMKGKTSDMTMAQTKVMNHNMLKARERDWKLSTDSVEKQFRWVKNFISRIETNWNRCFMIVSYEQTISSSNRFLFILPTQKRRLSGKNKQESRKMKEKHTRNCVQAIAYCWNCHCVELHSVGNTTQIHERHFYWFMIQ